MADHKNIDAILNVSEAEKINDVKQENFDKESTVVGDNMETDEKIDPVD